MFHKGNQQKNFKSVKTGRGGGGGKDELYSPCTMSCKISIEVFSLHYSQWIYSYICRYDWYHCILICSENQMEGTSVPTALVLNRHIFISSYSQWNDFPTLQPWYLIVTYISLHGLSGMISLSIVQIFQLIEL